MDHADIMNANGELGRKEEYKLSGWKLIGKTQMFWLKRFLWLKKCAARRNGAVELWSSWDNSRRCTMRLPHWRQHEISHREAPRGYLTESSVSNLNAWHHLLPHWVALLSYSSEVHHALTHWGTPWVKGERRWITSQNIGHCKAIRQY